MALCPVALEFGISNSRFRKLWEEEPDFINYIIIGDVLRIQ